MSYHSAHWCDHPSINSYVRNMGCAGKKDQLGVPQIFSLFTAIRSSFSKTQLQSFEIWDVSWRFLPQAEGPVLDMMKQVMEPVKRFKIFINTAPEDEVDDEFGSEEISKCREFLEVNNSLHDFLSAATELEHLYIDFACAFDHAQLDFPADFHSIVHPTEWSTLHTLNIGYIEITKPEWLAFLDRHASTLKRLTLNSIALSRGSWIDVLESMQRKFKFESVQFHLGISGMDSARYWNLIPGGRNKSGRKSQGDRTKKALEDFFSKGGLYPLRDSAAHPNRLQP